MTSTATGISPAKGSCPATTFPAYRSPLSSLLAALAKRKNTFHDHDSWRFLSLDPAPSCITKARATSSTG